MTSPTLHNEYAVIDDLGQMMGMPARTWATEKAAFDTKKLFDDRITAMKDAAERAKVQLASNVIDGRELTANERAMLREMVDHYNVNAHRRYTVMERQVTAWKAVT